MVIAGSPAKPAALELVARWLDALSGAEGKSPATVSSYRAAVRRFVVDVEIGAPETITRDAIERHAKRLTLAGVGPSRLASSLVAIRSWCNWLCAHGLLLRSPALGMKPPRVYRRAKRPLTVAEVKRLVLGEGGGLPRGRDELISTVAFAVAYAAALRPSEIGRLRLTDVEWDGDEEIYSLLLREAKHADSDVRQPIANPVARLLGAYLQLRPSLGPGPFLFPGRGERPLSDPAIAKLFAGLVAARGIEPRGRRLTPKILRTSRCTHLLHARHHPTKVQHFMRHSRFETTMEHYSWVDDDSVVAMLRKGEPLAGKRRSGPAIQGAMRQLLEELGGRPGSRA